MGCECLPGDAWLEQDVDILVPGSHGEPDQTGQCAKDQPPGEDPG